MTSKFLDILKYVAVTALTLLMLYLAFRGMDWNAFAEGLKSCNFWWLLAAMVVGLLTTVFRGLRWRLLLLPIDPDVRRVDCCNAYAACYLSNIAVLRSGELVRCGMVADNSKVPFKDSLGSMMIERAWDVAVSAVLLLAMILFTRFGSFMIENVWNPFVASLSGRVLWIVLGVAAPAGLCIWAFIRYKDKILSSRIGSKVVNFCNGILNGIKAAFKMKHAALFFVYTVLIHVMYWLEVLCVIQAFPAVSHLTGADAFFIMMLGLIGWAIPVQGGFGAYHVIVSMALVPIYGIDQQSALIFATISHETQIVQMLVVGSMALLIAFLIKRNRNKQNQIKTI